MIRNPLLHGPANPLYHTPGQESVPLPHLFLQRLQ